MYTIEFTADRTKAPGSAICTDQESTLQLLAALKAGYAYKVTACGLNLTEGFAKELAKRASARPS